MFLYLVIMTARCHCFLSEFLGGGGTSDTEPSYTSSCACSTWGFGLCFAMKKFKTFDPHLLKCVRKLCKFTGDSNIIHKHINIFCWAFHRFSFYHNTEFCICPTPSWTLKGFQLTWQFWFILWMLKKISAQNCNTSRWKWTGGRMIFFNWT